MKTLTRMLTLLVAVGTLCGCSREKSSSYITGTINYRMPINLESGTVLELRLTDVSVSDGAALVVAQQTVKELPTLPFRYSLPYDAAKINPEHRYTIDTRIVSNNQLLFATDTAYQVLTQGNSNQRDMTVIDLGTNDTASTSEPSSHQTLTSKPSISIFQNELRTGQQVSLYKAGMQQGHVLWLEEDRSSGTPQPLHARYEFKGALIMHYADSSAMEVNFDERGRPLTITKNRQALKLSEQADAINVIRNRAELLRSHALAASETRAHRQATGG